MNFMTGDMEDLGNEKREKRSDSGADEGGKPPNEGEKLSEKVDTVFPPGRLLRHTDLCCAQQAEKHEAREEGFSESMEKGEERVLQEGGGAVLDPESGERNKRSLAYPCCYQRDRGCSGDPAACLGQGWSVCGDIKAK